MNSFSDRFSREGAGFVVWLSLLEEFYQVGGGFLETITTTYAVRKCL